MGTDTDPKTPRFDIGSVRYRIRDGTGSVFGLICSSLINILYTIILFKNFLYRSRQYRYRTVRYWFGIGTIPVWYPYFTLKYRYHTDPVLIPIIPKPKIHKYGY